MKQLLALLMIQHRNYSKYQNIIVEVKIKYEYLDDVVGSDVDSKQNGH